MPFPISVLWELPVVFGLDNPMLEEERVQLQGDLTSVKADAKKRIQRRFGLEENPKARLFVSLGRLVRQKGVDLIADVADWLLSNFANAQLIFVGPVGDGFGQYAANKLEALKEHGRHDGRLHLHMQFLRDKEILKDVKLGADFCLMPSSDEPFGYVDIEFAWHGALSVGAQAGGLGKVPGFYFLARNRENLDHLREELRTAVTKAMNADLDQLHRMADEAISCTFPLDRAKTAGMRPTQARPREISWTWTNQQIQAFPWSSHKVRPGEGHQPSSLSRRPTCRCIYEESKTLTSSAKADLADLVSSSSPSQALKHADA